MATVPAIYTFTDGPPAVTAAELNTLGQGINLLLTGRPLCKAHQATAQALTTGTSTAITFDTTDIDTDGGRTGTGSATDRYVARTQGWYFVAATVSYVQATAGDRFAILAVNGVNQNGFGGSAPAPGANTGITLAGLVHMNVGDYLQVLGYQDTGAALNTAISPTYQASSLSLSFELAG